MLAASDVAGYAPAAPKGILKAGFAAMASRAEGNLNVPRGKSFGCPANTSIPLRITGVVSLELELAVDAVGVVRSLDAAEGEGDFPFAAPGDVLCGDMDETDPDLLPL